MILTLDNVSFTYDENGPYEAHAIQDITMTIQNGEFVGMIGRTGSGKSTLLQVLGGLNRPTSGTVCIDGSDIYQISSTAKKRKRIGLVFQYPEYQLFESTVKKDVAFGAKNRGLSEEEASQKAEESLRMANLKQECWDLSPFELSGGEKRRAAIAGVYTLDGLKDTLDVATCCGCCEPMVNDYLDEHHARLDVLAYAV